MIFNCLTDHRIFFQTIKGLLVILAFTYSTISTAFAQRSIKSVDDSEAYTRTINDRSGRIVSTLNISDPSKSLRVRNIIAGQYRSLNNIYAERDVAVSEAKAKEDNNDASTLANKLNSIQQETKGKLDKLHEAYLNKLSVELTPAQIDQVKDSMTYGVVQLTYKGYQSMIPTLTEEQKKKILTWLTEARELAMDAESSDKKHAWFGKYKGKINNYLSAAGYDLKKAGEEWQNRIKADAASKKNKIN